MKRKTSSSFALGSFWYVNEWADDIDFGNLILRSIQKSHQIKSQCKWMEIPNGKNLTDSLWSGFSLSGWKSKIECEPYRTQTLVLHFVWVANDERADFHLWTEPIQMHLTLGERHIFHLISISTLFQSHWTINGKFSLITLLWSYCLSNSISTHMRTHR